MGASNAWLPYLLGAIFGHLLTIVSWITTSIVEKILKAPASGHSLSSSSFPIECPEPTSTFSITTTVLARDRSWVKSDSGPDSGASGVELSVLWLAAILSWCISLVLAWVLWCRRCRVIPDIEPVPPSIQDIARSQLAELRLRRHGISR